MPRRRLSSHPAGQWWLSLDKVTLSLVLVLMACGLLAVALASNAVARTYDVGAYYFLTRQFIFVLMAVPTMMVLSMLPVRAVKLLGWLMFTCCLVGLVLTLLLGQDVKGATRWIYLAGLSIQPSEFLKPALAIVTATLLAFSRDSERQQRFWLSLILVGTCLGLLFLQPDFGMIVMHGAVWGTQVFLSGVPLLWIFMLAGFGALVMVGGYMALPHVRSRVARFLDPSSGDSYQVDQAREALLSGGLWGRGAGEGVVKYNLPDAHTDFILAVIGEEFGMIICLVLLCVYGYIITRVFRRLMQLEDRFVILAGTGLVMVLSLQVLVNTGVVLNVLPTTGMTLPFISYGGSATLTMAIVMGLLLSLTRIRKK